MEYKLFHEVYLSVNPITVKKDAEKGAILKNMKKGLEPKVYIDHMSERNGVPQYLEQIDLKKEFELQEWREKELRNSVLELENKNLAERIKELERINLEKTNQINEIKNTLGTERRLFQEWRFLSYQRIKEDNQIMTIERFIKEIENIQSIRSQNLRRTVKSSKQYDSQDSIWSFTSDAEKWKKGNLKIQNNSETELSPRCLIISMMKELQYIYSKIPEDCSKKFEPILNQNEEIFIKVVNNKIRLNEILEL